MDVKYHVYFSLRLKYIPRIICTTNIVIISTCPFRIVLPFVFQQPSSNFLTSPILLSYLLLQRVVLCLSHFSFHLHLSVRPLSRIASSTLFFNPIFSRLPLFIQFDQLFDLFQHPSTGHMYIVLIDSNTLTLIPVLLRTSVLLTLSYLVNFTTLILYSISHMYQCFLAWL